MASFPARATRRGGESRSRGSGRSSPSSGAPFVARLQSTAGNRAVAQLLTDGLDHGPIDNAAAPGNRAATSVLAPVQREDEKKDGAGGDAKPADATAKKADAKGGGADTKALRKAWADAGLVAGGPLYDLINDDLSLAKLLDLGLPELGGLVGKGTEAAFDKATEAGGTKGQVKSIGLDTKEAGQVGGALAGWAAGAAEKWLKTESGKRFLAKAQGVINEHPKAAYWTIVSTLAAGIAGAVTGYCLGAFDPPEFKKQFEIRGIKIDAAADLGNIKEKVLHSAKLALSFKAGPGTLAVSGTAKEVTEGKGKDAKKGDEYGAAVSYGGGDANKGAGEAKGTVGATYNTANDQTSVSLGAAYKYKPLVLDTTWKFQGDGSGVLDTSVTGKLSDNLTLTGQTTVGAYGPASKDAPLGYKLSLTGTQGKDSDKVSLTMDAKTKDVRFGVEQTRQLLGGAFTTATDQSLMDGSSTAGVSYARNALKADLKYSVDKAGKETLDVGASGKGEGLDAAFAAKFGLDTGQIEKLTVKLGFTTPDETLKFLHDLSIEISQGKVDAKATETIKLRLKQIAVEVEGSIGEKGGKTTASGRFEVGWKMPGDIVLGVGVTGAQGTGAKGGVPAPWMVTPGISVSHADLPVRLVGGVSVPVGPGSEGMPPVFGVSISPNFDFLKDKKK